MQRRKVLTVPAAWAAFFRACMGQRDRQIYVIRLDLRHPDPRWQIQAAEAPAPPGAPPANADTLTATEPRRCA